MSSTVELWTTRTLDDVTRVGWIDDVSPLTPLQALAARLGVKSLVLKRDDLLGPLCGGSKLRKLDFLLATSPFAGASTWRSVGAIGSSHLVALTAAARVMGRRFEAHCFWQPPLPSVLDNLAFTASGPTDIRYHRNRATMALRCPGLVLGFGAVPTILPGGTTPASMLGLVCAGLELAEQVRAGDLPAPERVYVALGTGGIAVGLAVGLALGGLRTVVHAIAVVERMLATGARLARLRAALLAHLARIGHAAPEAPSCPIVIDRTQLGAGYGDATPAALAACETLASEGIALDPVYTGKAMAALFADARRGPLGPVLVWHTRHRQPLPREDDWRRRLPPALARRLDAAASTRAAAAGRRRVFVATGAAALIGAAGWYRLGGYRPLPHWRGRVLARWEALVLEAASEVVLPSDAGAAERAAAPAIVDGYLVWLPRARQREVHMLLGLVEHATPLGGRLSRFTRLTAPERDAFLRGLEARGGLLAQAYRGLRELCFLGYYAQPASWAALGYEGPRVGPWRPLGDPERPVWPSYDELRATAGTLPRGVIA